MIVSDRDTTPTPQEIAEYQQKQKQRIEEYWQQKRCPAAFQVAKPHLCELSTKP